MMRERDKDLPANEKSTVAPNQPDDLAKTQNSAPPPPAAATGGAAPKPPKEENYSAETEAQKQQPVQDAPVQNQRNITPDSRNAQSSPRPSAQRAEAKRKSAEPSRNDAQEDKSVETTNVGGRTFRRANNVWTDAAYRGQSATNVTRGTKEYKKLDSGLRAIAENLGGTVIVVWKEKAYRIQ